MNITKTIVAERDRALIGGDYSTYHAQATRRIQSLRKRLGASTPRGRKYTQKPAVTAEDISKNVQWVSLLLASAERAWADAMHMKTSQSPENTQKPLSGATKRQIVSRLRRAILYATNLIEVLQDQTTTSATAQDLLEAKAYSYMLKGTLDFERSRWQPCIQNYAFVHVVYTTLLQSESDVFRDLLEGTIDPSIRYTGYQQKLPRTKAVSDIATESFPQSETTARKSILDLDNSAFETTAEKAAAQAKGAGDLPSTINWRGRSVKLEDASISQALAIADQKAKSLTDTAMLFRDGKINAKDLAAAYDQVIDATQEAADATKVAIDELLAEGVSQSDSRVQSLQVSRTAINYRVIEWQVGRNRVLCGTADGLLFEPPKPKKSKKQMSDQEQKLIKDEPTGRKVARLRERTALYDSILQSLDAVKQLPGVASDTAFVEELTTKRSYFRALKCIAIGRSYAINGNVANALALFSRSMDLSKSVTSSTEATSAISKLDINKSQLTALQSHIDSLTLQYRALTELSNISKGQEKASQTKTHKPVLIHRLYLNQYDDDVDLQNIVNYPPKVEPIPMQPMILDLAFDHIVYPGSKHENSTAVFNTTGDQESTAEQPKKKGWFGFGR